ncbi:MAG TPA: LacI family DNA-binding transcriptional regulator [Bauldia sp.]|nr:LacI family DNA-binding transcriptional regulator [Bauldia sp.]
MAARAGVSPATVSNALSGLRGVTGDRRRAVLEAVEALGYKSNHMASSLRRGETRTVGIVVPDLGNEYFAGLVRQWEKIASTSGYEMLVVASGEDPATEARRIESLIARRIDGLLVVAAGDDFGANPAFPERLPPTVLVDRAYGHPDFDTVASNNLDAAYRGCRHLIEIGHREITLLIASMNHTHLRDRVEGYRRALREAGLAGRERIVFGGGTMEGCRSAIEQDLRRSDPPTAVFAATFYATLGAVKAINALEADFPRTVSLLGFERSEWMTAVRPYISAVEQSVDDLAKRSWLALRDRMAGDTSDPKRVLLDLRLVIRESTRPPGYEPSNGSGPDPRPTRREPRESQRRRPSAAANIDLPAETVRLQKGRLKTKQRQSSRGTQQ